MILRQIRDVKIMANLCYVCQGTNEGKMMLICMAMYAM